MDTFDMPLYQVHLREKATFFALVRPQTRGLTINAPLQKLQNVLWVVWVMLCDREARGPESGLVRVRGRGVWYRGTGAL